MNAARYFDSGTARLFGWCQLPSPSLAANFGVVVCKPFGYEAICAYRGIRAFSDAVASMGAPVLRFDYAGTGDSSDIDPLADQVGIWIADTIAAVAELQRLGRVEKVYLLGFRLGALIAALASSQCSSVAGLILVAPIFNGRRYARELRTMRMAAAGRNAPDSDPNAMEVGGFSLSAASMATLAGIVLKPEDIRASTEVLVIDGASMPISRRWSEELRDSAIPTTYRSLPGMVEMLMTAPQFASMPGEMIAAMLEWLRDRRGTAMSIIDSHFDAGACDFAATSRSLSLTHPEAPQDDAITEFPVFLKSEPRLFGIVTKPARQNSNGEAVILVNAGADYHIGASGMYVDLARNWARIGFIVFRMDLQGIGDSDAQAGRPDNEVFPPRAVDDMRAAVEWLRSECCAREITLGGLCSGAYHALQAAFAALPISRAVMINPQNYFWSEDRSIYGRQELELVSGPTATQSSIVSTKTWIRLWRGEIDLPYIMGTYSRGIYLRVESRIRNLARRLRIRLPNDLGWQLEDAVARGTRLFFIFARGEPGLDLLRMQAGVSLDRLGNGCEIRIIDGADHVFSRLEWRVLLRKILSEELTVRH